MLAGIFGKKSDHPLADVKSAQELLDNLPKNDAIKSLMELTELIESVTDNADFKLDHQFAVLRMIDEAAQSYARKLTREYFTPFEINKFQENRLWLVLSNYYRQVFNAYFAAFDRFCSAEKGSNTIKSQVPLITARAVNAIICQLKYICSRYGQIENAIWSNLAQLYKHAEQLQYLDTPVRLYPGLTSSTSVKCEVGALLVWYDSGLSALSPLCIHLSERIVTQFCTTIDIHTEIGNNSRLAFDLNRPAEPTRINMGATTHLAMRFISMPTMQAKMEVLMIALKKNIVPDDLYLGGNYEAAVVKEAAEHLLSYLIAPPVRRNVRRMANVALNVVNGFETVVGNSNAGQSHGGQDPARWVTEEISVGGFSSVLPPGSDSIGIGSLLGIQPEGVSHWGVAVVRRLLRDDANQLRAGAEILANQVAGVIVNQNGGEPGDGQTALWLYAKQGAPSGGGQLLLMKADTFSSSRSLKVRLEGKNYLLIPVGLQEKGLDYDLAKFKIIEQEGNSEEIT
ncbi:MAG TPA: hypothetical protein VMJ33_06665 [Gallionella sp.]|nr:hypothetical protein [Gallionella sp.]